MDVSYYNARAANLSKDRLVVSKTAVQTGFGSDRYKNVVWLTRAEREAARSGMPVYFKSSRLSGGNHGTLWREAQPYGNGSRFCPRVPGERMIALLEKSFS